MSNMSSGNKVVISECTECHNWCPANSYGYGTYCDELRKIIHLPKSGDYQPIPDECPKLINDSDVIIDISKKELEDGYKKFRESVNNIKVPSRTIFKKIKVQKSSKLRILFQHLMKMMRIN